MKIVCLGGGPAGLYFGLLMKLQNPENEVIVVERNRVDETGPRSVTTRPLSRRDFMAAVASSFARFAWLRNFATSALR